MGLKGILNKVTQVTITQTLNKLFAPQHSESASFVLNNDSLRNSNTGSSSDYIKPIVINSSTKLDFKEFPKLPLLDIQFISSNIKANHIFTPQTNMQDMFIVDEEKWQGGKPKGNIQLMGNIYYIRHSDDIIKKISILDFETLDQAFNEANQFLYDYSKKHNLLRNEYRIVEDSKGKYLEVKAGNKSFYCDLDHQKVIQEFIWNIKQDGTVYAKHSGLSDKSEVLFHKYAAGHLDSSVKIIHLDSNKRNNRSYNFKVKLPTSFNPNTGTSLLNVYKSGNFWYSRSTGKTGKVKKFSISKYGEEEAFRLANENKSLKS